MRVQACFIGLPHSLHMQHAGNNTLDCFIKQSNIFLKKNDTGYSFCIFIIFKLRSTTEQMPALAEILRSGLGHSGN
jgi:hypothetical protein